ncbi:MAG: SAM-dependent chlorinase/fluorinase [Desulfobacteraceae bacterium]|nr:SAM-dependent chlorinase/fluorinase [Desulfobacteraceae bacterium]
MSVVSLLTDFGLSDPYAGIMKGVIASICPEARIIDITHLIAPQDVYQAAYALAAAYPYFANNTVHAVVVDPGVGSERRIVAVKTEVGVFLAPDNGVLTPVIEEQAVLAAFLVENPDIFIHPVSRTFHGRDILAPAAARLACGMDISKLGTLVDSESLVRLDFGSPPVPDENERLCGSVIAVDRFGNLITNIRQTDLKKAFGGSVRSRQDICIQVGGQIIRGISDFYSSVKKGSLLAITGSTGRLEISVNEGDASRELNLGRRDQVIVFPCKGTNG